jgi:uncharacterized membrane protein
VLYLKYSQLNLDSVGRPFSFIMSVLPLAKILVVFVFIYQVVGFSHDQGTFLGYLIEI